MKLCFKEQKGTIKNNKTMAPLYKLKKWIPQPCTNTTDLSNAMKVLYVNPHSTHYLLHLLQNVLLQNDAVLHSETFYFHNCAVKLYQQLDFNYNLHLDNVIIAKKLLSTKNEEAISYFLLNIKKKDFGIDVGIDFVKRFTMSTSNGFLYIHRMEISEYYNSVLLVKDYPELIDWPTLSANPGAIDFLLKPENRPKINWSGLSKNPHTLACELLMDPSNYDNIDWSQLCLNPNPLAIQLLAQNTHKLKNKDWHMLSQLTHCKESIELLRQHPEKINWYWISKNELAISLLEQYPDKIHWEMFSANTHPRAIARLSANVEKIDWQNLSSNKAAVDLLRQHPDKICWYKLAFNVEPEAIDLFHQYNMTNDMLYSNPNIFEYDYEKMQQSHSELKQHLLEQMLHPDNYSKFADWGLVS